VFGESGSDFIHNRLRLEHAIKITGRSMVVVREGHGTAADQEHGDRHTTMVGFVGDAIE